MRSGKIVVLVIVAALLAAFGPRAAFGQDRRASLPQTGSGAPSGRMLGTLQRGRWECALPGDAGAEAFRVIEAERFRIGNASSYESPEGAGIYLLSGTELVFTRGPKKDQRYLQLGENTLQKRNADGSLSKLICTRIGAAD